MKNSKFLFIGLLSFGLAFASCSSDDDDDDKTPPPAPPVHELVGTWEAYDASFLLNSIGITGITATFKSNNSYVVTSHADGADTVLEGTYTISEEANEEGIYEITLVQSLPTTLTSEGILKIYEASPDSMWYEVAQTIPNLEGVSPPTLDAGFGSTSEGAYQTWNIQKYYRQ